MKRFTAIGAIVLMVAASLCLPLGAVHAEANNPTQVLKIDYPYVVSGTETWQGVSVLSSGSLTVPKGATLQAGYIKISGAPFEVNGGTVILSNSIDGQDVYIGGGPNRQGSVTYFNLTEGARLVLRAPNGNNILDTSQGCDAAINVDVTKTVNINSASIECYGGNGFSNPVPWVDHASLIGYYAAGGNGSVRIGSKSTLSNSVKDLTVTLTGGNGGKAANGNPPNAYIGGAGGGYSNAGLVGDHVGAGGMGTVILGGRDLTVSGLVVTATGGKGGRAGDAGSRDTDFGSVVGGGGGGGYGGGNGGDYTTGGTRQAEKATVKDFVGSGGMVNYEFNAINLTVFGLDLTASSGRGGDAGNGGQGSYYCGGGGGGFGGGGGTFSTGASATNRGGDGMVSGRVGAGGNVLMSFSGDNWISASNISVTAVAGNGGTGGNGGNGGGSYAGGTAVGYGGGGGGGFGGGGGGGYYDSGGHGIVSNEVGTGGNSTVQFAGGPIEVTSCTFVMFGGTGGMGGMGGRGGYYGGGGGGGFGGGGGVAYGYSAVGPGTGQVFDSTGRGGSARVTMTSTSGPGEVVARSNKLYLVGGAGGDGGSGGLGGYTSGGGGGGYVGGGGRYSASTYTGTTPPLGILVGCGGAAEFNVYHVAPSISRLNSVSLLGGKPGNGKNQPGAGSIGGLGTGQKTSQGNAIANIPMGVVSINSPKPGEVVNSIPPTFEWEPIFSSSTDGDVVGYNLQIDTEVQFPLPVVDMGVELQTSFSPTSELASGGVYFWRVMATYATGNSFGYGPTEQFSFNTPPILKRNFPLTVIKEDTVAYHCIPLTNYFFDDLYTNQLQYTIITETDPSHILATVDGDYLTFTTPTKDWYGQERFAVRAMDKLGLWTNSNNFTVRVSAVNDPPVLLSMPDIMATEGEDHFVDLSPYVYDPDSLQSDMIMSTNVSYCRVSGLNLILNYVHGGGITEDWIALNVSDGFDYTITILHVIVQKYNSPPSIIGPSPWVEYVTEDTDYSRSLAELATDVETPASEVVWNVTAVSAGNPPIFNAFITSRNMLKIIPAPDANGQGSIVLVAIDKGGKEDTRTVQVVVNPINDPPVMEHLPDMMMVAGTTKYIDMSKYISDVDNPLSELKLISSSPLANPEGLKLTVFVKPDAQENQDLVQLKVSDGTDTATSEFLVKIVFRPTIPQLIPTIKTSADKDKLIDLKEFVYDKDTPEAALSWEISGVNQKYFTASIDPNTHILKIIPKSTGSGEITLKVTDPEGGTASQVVRFSINKVDQPMVIPAGIYVLIAFMVVVAVVGVSLAAMRRRSD
jgi:hypothetical protein